MKRITIYRILVVVVLLLMAIWQISMPRQLVVHTHIYTDPAVVPTPERMMPGEPARGWELPVVIY